MDIMQKLKILADAAKYDVSCSSSGSSRRKRQGSIGNTAASGICHSWSDDGRCISLLKILYTNYCVYDCIYCVNRSSNDVERASFTPREIADLTINFYRRNYIEGLFLSSAVLKSPDYTMEKLVQTIKILRHEYFYDGYIHLKAIPGADSNLILQAGQLVDRMSVNIELPSNTGLKKLAPQKKKADILRPMGLISSQIAETHQERKKYPKLSRFVPAGQSTQLIVGATPDPDYQVLRLSESLYQKFALKRVYYSAYVPINHNPQLPVLAQPPLLREHRLYQADWLLRFYGFTADELLDEENPSFNLALDPKVEWALRNLHLFPMEINRVDYELLLRIPGIGVKSAKAIICARQESNLDFDDLKKIGLVMKRAVYFITCKGKYYGGLVFREDFMRQRLENRQLQVEQLSLF